MFEKDSAIQVGDVWCWNVCAGTAGIVLNAHIMEHIFVAMSDRNSTKLPALMLFSTAVINSASSSHCSLAFSNAWTPRSPITVLASSKTASHLFSKRRAWNVHCTEKQGDCFLFWLAQRRLQCKFRCRFPNVILCRIDFLLSRRVGLGGGGRETNCSAVVPLICTTNGTGGGISVGVGINREEGNNVKV